MAKTNAGGKEDKSIAGIDRIIHEPARLLIIANLYVLESAEFLFLQRQTGLTFGNLSSQLCYRVLQFFYFPVFLLHF